MERKKVVIFFFISYLIFILWLFEINDKKIDKKITVSNNENIIINHLSNVDGLLKTIDSIKSQTYQSQRLNLIIFDFSNEDIKSILSLYDSLFLKIHVIKSTNFKSHDHYLNLNQDILSDNNILILKSGGILPKNMIKELSNSFYQNNNSAVMIPVVNKPSHRKNIFFQLLDSFFTILKFSAMNKGLTNSVNLYNDSLMIKKDVFMNLLFKNYNNFSVQAELNQNIYIKHNESSILTSTNLKLFYVLYGLINILFIGTISLFVSNPSFYWLITILIKVIPESIIIYSYYNKLKIKFPRIDFIIYLIVSPFYILIMIFNNRKWIFKL